MLCPLYKALLYNAALINSGKYYIKDILNERKFIQLSGNNPTTSTPSQMQLDAIFFIESIV